MAQTETGLPADGMYWLRKADYTDVAKVEGRYLTGLQLHGRVEGFVDAGWQFTPASPLDAEQLMELRKVAQNALHWFESRDMGRHAPFVVAELRAALNPSHAQTERQ